MLNSSNAPVSQACLWFYQGRIPFFFSFAARFRESAKCKEMNLTFWPSNKCKFSNFLHWKKCKEVRFQNPYFEKNEM